MSIGLLVDCLTNIYLATTAQLILPTLTEESTKALMRVVVDSCKWMRVSWHVIAQSW